MEPGGAGIVRQFQDKNNIYWKKVNKAISELFDGNGANHNKSEKKKGAVILCSRFPENTSVRIMERLKLLINIRKVFHYMYELMINVDSDTCSPKVRVYRGNVAPPHTHT